MKKIVVVGGGPSGMMAAITAAREGAFVTLLEQKEKVGKKLLMTGNGRCNLTNMAQQVTKGYQEEQQSFLAQCFLQYAAKDTIRFFEELGMKTKQRGDLVYPVTDCAATVREILLMELKRNGVKVKCCEKVTSLEIQNDLWIVKTEGWQYEADRVILAAGSNAVPATGSDGTGYALARKLSLKIKKPLAALVPLKCKGEHSASLAGLRSYVRLTLAVEGKGVQKEEGELQWTEYGISGIVIFQVSAKAARALEEKRKVEIWVDLVPFMEQEELVQFWSQVMQFDEKKTAEEILTGIFPKKMAAVLLESMRWKKSKAAKEYTKEEWRELAQKCKNLCLFVTGTKSFEQAQICCGGIERFEVNPQTLESVAYRGLYIAGEILDIDGKCGGYNLQWAWTSGYICGIHAAKGK